MTEKEIQLLGLTTKNSSPLRNNIYSVHIGELNIIGVSNDGGKTWSVRLGGKIQYHSFAEAQALLNNLERHVVRD